MARLTATRAPADRLRRRVSGWIRRRTANTGNRIRLDRRRLFVLPTRLGYAFAGTLALLLVGSLNYSASLGFALTFLLAGCGALGMLHTYRNLEGVVFGFSNPAPAFAGEPARFPVEIESAQRERWAVEMSTTAGTRSIEHVAPMTPTHTHLLLPTAHRGRLRLPRVGVATRWPLPLFRVWTYLEPEVSTIVYPAPVDHGHTRPWSAGAAGPTERSRGDEEFAGLREYHPGDPPRRIAWKALARTDQLRVKEFEGAGADETWLDWNSLAGLHPEARLEQLCCWVLTADRRGAPYGLVLPDARVAPATGPEHRRRCLEALALSGGSERP